MFTGLIQALGRIKPLGGDKWQINCVGGDISAIMQDLAHGDSVAVDGVCLTVEDILQDGFIVTASPETLRKTILVDVNDSHYVNLETSLRVGSKVGGHFVMGHVDGVGQLVATLQTASSWEMTFTAPDAIARYLVPKGSIAINGISLTIADYQPEQNQFTVAVIPITYTETNLRYLTPGSPVNLEGDIIGKYVEKFTRLATKDSQYCVPTQEFITPAFLSENGYL
ncbi:riboflavin synthase [Calothrix sp. NIES-3974]|uniref:riboflavin synthase n=1 Tax=Calothrix sp. NIES-3974 TaxID=2005462 RepID=UPI000B5F077B|nr:riboflavin synthase [Calothrix sp. NIES-3974]BAZ03751.1 riboflavin synthase alpha chain [Calothrix sp. NIES-3974]